MTHIIGFCEGLALQLSGALARFRDDWLTEVAALDAKGLASARKREEACFAHIRRGLVVALERDPNVAHDRLLGALAPEPLCAFVWDSMLSRPSNEAIPDAKPCSPSCAARCTSPHSHEIMQQYERRPTCSI